MSKKNLRPQTKFFPNKPSIVSVTAAFCFLYVCVVLFNPLAASSHSQLPTTPCDIRLVFGTDMRGMPSVAYKLSLQIRNRAARNITGVSVYWLDRKSTIIGNSNVICGTDDFGIGPSEAGHCEKVVQQIGGNLLKSLGQTTWTDIINNELTDFEKIDHCAIIGYEYQDHN